MDIISIYSKKVFPLGEANSLLPIVKKITKKYATVVDSLISRLESLESSQSGEIEELEEKVNLEIRKWHTKIKSLGAKPNGLWLVDFDSGEGYYCWKYPEEEIRFWHSYSEGYKGRVELVRPRVSPEQNLHID